MERLIVGLAAIVVAIAAAACGAGSSTVTQTVRVTSTVTVPGRITVTLTTPAASAATSTASSTTSTASGGTTPTTASGGTTPTTPSGGTVQTPACTAAALAPVILGSAGATGRVVLTLALRNRTSGPCHTYGWPGIAFAAADGSALPTSTARTTSDLLGSTPPAKLTLDSGQDASFRIIVPDSNNGSTANCHTAGAVRIIAPDDTATIVAGLRAPVTECGTATVSPLLAGNDALPGV